MTEEVNRLVIAPFKDIVEKGNLAVENSKDADDETQKPMLKAAQSLVKEGDRALKKLEPLCLANYEEYGSNFIDAIKENDEIAQYRSQLEELLWDFDDYVEVDEFDATQFDALQKASRQAAPKVLDILKRMKLVPAAPTSKPGSRPISHDATQQKVPTPSLSIVDQSSSPTTPAERLLDEVIGLMGPNLAGPGVETSLDYDERRRSHRSATSDSPTEPPPEPPTANPWQVGRPPSAPQHDNLTESTRASQLGNGLFGDSPTIHPISPHSTMPPSARARAYEDGVDPLHREDDDGQMRAASRSAVGYSEGSRSPDPSHRWTSSTQASFEHTSSSLPVRSNSGDTFGWTYNSPTNRSSHDMPSFTNHSPIIPEEAALSNHRYGDNQGSQIPRHMPKPNLQPNSTRHPSTDSVNSSVFDLVDVQNARSSSSSHARDHSNSLLSSPTSPYTYPQPPAYPGYPAQQVPPYQFPRDRASSNASNTLTQNSGTTMHAYPGMELMRTNNSMEGLIPVHTEASLQDHTPLPPREPDCSIGPGSSFYKLKGFCKGAEEAVRGTSRGYKKYKRPVGGFAFATVAKCKDCLFELEWDVAERDYSQNPAAYFSYFDVNFRLRALQKCHLPARNIEEQLYGCLFCIELGHTIDESDATVFFNQRQLFAHLARHPRPLPPVPGLTVIEGDEIPLEHQGSFDFHFPKPAVDSVMKGLMPEINRLPTGSATETRKTANGVQAMRGPPDRTPVLQLAVGAKIVGIEFPPKYEGKWGIGWHDGVRAAFETDTVQIDAPPKNEIRMQGTSSLQATARWKWSQKGDDKWLKFDKGEIIKNIGWSYTDHWCWSGTSSKGWGVFPQSHMEPTSLRTAPGADDSESVSSGSGTIAKKGSIFKTGLRRNTDLSFDFLPNVSIPSLKSSGRDHNHSAGSPPAVAEPSIPRQPSLSSQSSLSYGSEVGRSRTMRAGL